MGLVTLWLLAAPAPTARGQSFGSWVLGNVPPVMPANTSSNVNAVIDIRAYRSIGFCFTATNSSGVDSLVTANFVRGDGALLWEGQPWLSLSMYVPNGTNTSVVTNIFTGAAGWLQCSSITNGAGVVSNLVIIPNLKPGA